MTSNWPPKWVREHYRREQSKRMWTPRMRRSLELAPAVADCLAFAFALDSFAREVERKARRVGL